MILMRTMSTYRFSSDYEHFIIKTEKNENIEESESLWKRFERD